MAHAEKYNRDSVTVDRQKKTVDVIIPTYRPDREFEKPVSYTHLDVYKRQSDTCGISQADD